MALKAYIDESGRNEEFFVLAGYISTAELWADSFAPNWQMLLDLRPPKHSPIEAFHMTEMQGDRERCEWFYRVIESSVVAEISCTISRTGLMKAFKEFPWRWKLEKIQAITDPYFFGFKAIIDMTAQHQYMLGISEPIDFIFDDVSEKVRCVEMWDKIKFFSDPKVVALMGDTPIFRNDVKTLPLQAADLYAYWVREWEVHHVPDQERRFPWKRNRAIPRLAFRFEEEDFIKEWRKFDDPEFEKRLLMSDKEWDALR